jgi:hypothetical protein
MARRVPRGGPRPEWPDEPDHGQDHGGDRGAQRNGYGQDGTGRGAPDQDQYGQDQYSQYQYSQSQYGQYGGPGYGAAAEYGQPQSYRGQDYNGYGPQGQAGQGGTPQGYGAQDYPGGPDYQGQGYQHGQGYQGGQAWGYDGQPTQAFGDQRNGNGTPYQGDGDPRGYQNGRAQGNVSPYGDTQRYEVPGQFGGGARPLANGQGGSYQGPGRGQGQGQGPGGPSGPGQPPRDRPPPRKVRFRRTRRFFRRRIVRFISAVVALCLVWVMFSVGQAAFKNNGQGVSANIAEWARDHGLGPIVTFGEWLSYNPPPKGGKPSFSLAVPSGEAVTPGKAPKDGKGGKAAKKGFVPDVPATLKSLAGAPIAGEGQWRVVERVKGEPAILTTFLRDATYTSEVNGIASIDQRLVTFSLRPGTEDPGSPAGSASWGVPYYIPSGQRTGLLATFNGGFKLDSAGGGFYLNGIYHGSLVKGAASVVYYKNGTIKIGVWGRDFTMNSSIVGVRQNLKLLVDHGKISPNLNQDIETNFGATLGGGYYVWRSGLGITKDGRIIYVYGPALDVQDLAELLQRAGAVEGMQMDINPAWMKFDYYQAQGDPSDPTPLPLLPTQQPSPYSYYTPSTRDFTAVYAR